jgi:hypothetical protein
MNSGMKFGQDIQVQLVRGSAPKVVVPQLVRRGMFVTGKDAGLVAGNFAIGGAFKVECFRDDGTRRWLKHVKNGIVNQGLNRLLNVMFQSATQLTTWYLDLINTGATLAAADTYTSHSGWSYTSPIAYSNATRPIWAPAASTAQSSTNTATVDFNINATATINGIAVVAGSNVNGDSASGSGVLWATGSFPGGEQPVVSGDTLKVTYTVNASAA